MKSFVKGLLILLVGVAIGVSGVFISPKVGETVVKLSGGELINSVDDTTSSATTTASYCTTCPVKILSADSGRQYARITNVSGTAVYLYLDYDLSLNLSGLAANKTAATSVITYPLSGIYLAANGGSLVIDDSFLFKGEVWASSTAASLQINATYN